MKIDFRCTGGFANLNLRYHADTERLPPNLAARLEGAVEHARLFDIAERDRPAARGGPPDVLTYHLSVQDEGRHNQVAATDVTAPDSLRPLLDLLQQLALDETAPE